MHNIEENTDAISLLESIYDMAAHLDLKVIVEGVENKEQLDIVQSIGFKYIQGFYYHKPSQLEAFKAHYMLGDR
ncbi:EAL domain-containing protein [Pseudoalteromonas sp. Hal099]